ncbi:MULTISPECIES: hypothetical protein [unclassified Cupriavidus]|uniref:hypothetical protein n=1 Tax=unclassified Cupriavidus TaxID=2640874 RepID=UPI0010F73AB9|nr:MULTISPECIES: hypothetical protein [unclassified Cupriavidus]MWL89739.1 hypothetical protein [Cupriavidus sp. SW-Y-13]
MRRRFKILLLSCACCALSILSLGAHAAWIDCNKQPSESAKAACIAADFPKLEREMAEARKAASESVFGPALDPSSEWQWMEKRSHCGQDVACLEALYQARIAELQSFQFAVKTDRAGNRMEPLIDNSSGVPDAPLLEGCTPDQQLCVRVSPKADLDEAWQWVEIQYAGTNPATYRFKFPTASTSKGAVSALPWATVLRTDSKDNSIVVGLRAITSDIYVTWDKRDRTWQTHLFRITRRGTTFQSREILTLPSAVIRRFPDCKSDSAEDRRKKACPDHYFFSTLTLDRNVESGFPQLVYDTEASKDSGSPLPTESATAKATNQREGADANVIDPVCSFTRTFRLDDRGVYAPDSPMPDCSRYIGP